MAKIAVLEAGLVDEDVEGYVMRDQSGIIGWYNPKFAADTIFPDLARHDIEQLWVVPGAAPVRRLQPGNIEIMFEHPEDEQGKSFVNADMGGWKFNRYGDDYLSSCFGYREGGTPAERKMRGIIWPEFSGWQLEPGSISGPAMLAALNRLQGGLGVNLSSSPGVTGRNLVVEILKNQNHSHWLGSIAMDLAELPLKAGVADLAWKAELGASGPEVIERLSARADLRHAQIWYLHCIDKNSMYLSACAGLPMGIGNPVYVDDPDYFAAPALNGAGLFHIASITPPMSVTSDHPWRLYYDGQLGPDPLYGSLEKENRQEWVSTPLLKLLYDFGYGVILDKAWIWANTKRILEVPASQLWQLRQQLRLETFQAVGTEEVEAASAAYSWLKTIATSFIGLFASDMVKDQRYRRRDIWRLVIETAKARMLYNIDKAAEEIGMLPVAVLTDALYYVSSYPDAHLALGSIMNRHDQLGGFKLEYTLPIDGQVAAALAAKDVSSMARQLNEIAEQKEAVITWR